MLDLPPAYIQLLLQCSFLYPTRHLIDFWLVFATAMLTISSSSSSSHSPSSSPKTLLQTLLHMPFLFSRARIMIPGRCHTLAQKSPLALPFSPSNRQKRTDSRMSQALIGKLATAKDHSVTPAAHRDRHNGMKARLYRRATRLLRAGFVHASMRRPAFLYSSRIGQLRAMKWGNCHANRKPAMTQPPIEDPSLANRSSRHEPSLVAVSPAAAAQPIRGGIPPTTAPIQVLKTVTALRGVYIPAYITILAKPSPETVGLTPKYKAPVPTNPDKTANKTALRLEMRFRTNGRFRVRVILASVEGS